MTIGHQEYVTIKSVLYVTPDAGQRATVTVTAPSGARLFYTDWGHWAGVHLVPHTARSVTVASCGTGTVGYPGMLLVRGPTCLTYRVTPASGRGGVTRTVPVGDKTC